MRVIKPLVIGCMVIFSGSCVDPFDPDIEETEGVLVINGKITDKPGAHFVEVSRSSKLKESRFLPVEGCVVRVQDRTGTMITYTEQSPGKYMAELDEDFLGLNRAYKLFVDTPDGNQYESAHDTLLPCPEPANLYYEVESQPTADERVTYYGLQFYVDVKGGEDDSRHVMWELEETYEFHSNYLIGAIWDGVTFFEYDFPTDSLYFCYKTMKIKEIHVASSENLITNELTKYPLTFVSNQTPRLKHKYSLLAKQYSLSEEAFRFWDQSRILLTETGGFYETQPSTVPGNICNIHDDTELVLGYFHASQVKTKRITFRCSFRFQTPGGYYCEGDTISGISKLKGRYPYYMYSLSPTEIGPPYLTADPECFDCRLLGGTIVPPDFWYENE